MNPIPRFTFRSIALACALSSAPIAAQDLPPPDVQVQAAERYRANGREFIRYRFEVRNRASYSPELFSPAPNLPPCGTNRNASRSWVDIFRGDGQRLYGFCAIESPDKLDQHGLWFAIPADQPPPASIYIEVHDRQTGRKVRSAAASVPDLPVRSMTQRVGQAGIWTINRMNSGLLWECEMIAPTDHVRDGRISIRSIIGQPGHRVAFINPQWNGASRSIDIVVTGSGEASTEEGRLVGSEASFVTPDLGEFVEERADGRTSFWLGEASQPNLIGSFVVDSDFLDAVRQVNSCAGRR